MNRADPRGALQISKGGSSDLDAIARLMAESFDDRFGEGWTRSQCAGIMSMPGVGLWIARQDDRIVGFSLSRTIAGDSELLLLAVHPDHRRDGIGSILLKHFVKTSREKGANSIHLEVRDGNPAVAMYKAADFRVVGRRQNYYRGRQGEAFDALTLALHFGCKD